MVRLEREKDLSATFSGPLWISGTFVGHWPAGAANPGEREPEYLLVPHERSINRLPYFLLKDPPYVKPYRVRVVLNVAMRRTDLSWRSFLISEATLVTGYLVTATVYLHKPLSSALYGLAVCAGLVLALFALAARSIRFRGLPYKEFFKPHPRFPGGRHPRPKLEVLVGMLLVSGLQLAMFWPA